MRLDLQIMNRGVGKRNSPNQFTLTDVLQYFTGFRHGLTEGETSVLASFVRIIEEDSRQMMMNIVDRFPQSKRSGAPIHAEGAYLKLVSRRVGQPRMLRTVNIAEGTGRRLIVGLDPSDTRSGTNTQGIANYRGRKYGGNGMIQIRSLEGGARPPTQNLTDAHTINVGGKNKTVLRAIAEGDVGPEWAEEYGIFRQNLVQWAVAKGQPDILANIDHIVHSIGSQGVQRAVPAPISGVFGTSYNGANPVFQQILRNALSKMDLLLDELTATNATSARRQARRSLIKGARARALGMREDAGGIPVLHGSIVENVRPIKAGGYRVWYQNRRPNGQFGSKIVDGFIGGA